MLNDQSTQPRFYEVDGHTIYGVPPRAESFAAAPLTRRELRDVDVYVKRVAIVDGIVVFGGLAACAAVLVPVVAWMFS